MLVIVWFDRLRLRMYQHLKQLLFTNVTIAISIIQLEGY